MTDANDEAPSFIQEPYVVQVPEVSKRPLGRANALHPQTQPSLPPGLPCDLPPGDQPQSDEHLLMLTALHPPENPHFMSSPHLCCHPLTHSFLSTGMSISHFLLYVYCGNLKYIEK